MLDKTILSERLREARGDLSQAQAANAVGLAQQGWARYESGKVMPGAEAIHQICSCLNVSADWLLGLPERGGARRATAHGAGAVAVAGSVNSVKTGGDCSKCKLMQEHIREITGRK